MAKKPTVTTITSGFASQDQLNTNFTALRDAFDNTLSRDGSTPNTMSADLDMNSNDVLNVGTVTAQVVTVAGTPISDTSLAAVVAANESVAAAQAAQAAAEAAQEAAEIAASEIPVIADRTTLKSLDSSIYKVAWLNESGRQCLAQWNANILVADHQADARFERVYVAPNAGSNGAWVLRPEWPKASLSDVSVPALIVNPPTYPKESPVVAADRLAVRVPAVPKGQLPVLPWYPDPSVMTDGQQVIVTPLSGSPQVVVANGGKLYKQSDESEVTPWWVPPGATVVFDNQDDRYYWSGATKVIGDARAVTVAGKNRHSIEGVDGGIVASQEVTILVEWTQPLTHELTADHTLAGFTNTSATGGVTSCFLRNGGVANMGDISINHARAGGANASYVPLTYFGGASGSFRPLAHGRCRMVFSAAAGAAPIFGRDGFPVSQTGTSVSGTMGCNRISLGYRAINGGEDAPIPSDAIYDSLRVVIWPTAMTVAQVEAALEMSEKGLLPFMYQMDSYGFDPGLDDPLYPGGFGIPGWIKHQTSSEGYRCVGAEWYGGTAWYRETTDGDVNNFLTRIESRARQQDWVQVWIDGGMDETAGMVISGISEALDICGHDRFVIAETVNGTNKPYHVAGRKQYDVDTPQIAAWAGKHFTPTYDAMRAGSTGDPTLAAEVAAWYTASGNTGLYCGSATTFAALPTVQYWADAVQNGDFCILSAVDGANAKGIYVRTGGVWVFNSALTTDMSAMTALVIADSVADAVGTWPPSVLGDAIHPNTATGNPLYAAEIKARLDALDYSTSGQWL